MKKKVRKKNRVLSLKLTRQVSFSYSRRRRNKSLLDTSILESTFQVDLLIQVFSEIVLQGVIAFPYSSWNSLATILRTTWLLRWSDSGSRYLLLNAYMRKIERQKNNAGIGLVHWACMMHMPCLFLWVCKLLHAI